MSLRHVAARRHRDDVVTITSPSLAGPVAIHIVLRPQGTPPPPPRSEAAVAILPEPCYVGRTTLNGKGV